MSKSLFKITAFDHSDMRERNLAVILTALRKNAPISRSQLARITGLNKATVTSLTKELSEANLIRELEIIPSKTVGRPAVGLGLNPGAGSILAIEIGVDFISSIVTDFTAEIKWRNYVATTSDMGMEVILKRTLDAAREAYITAEGFPGRVFGVALGVPGLVDLERGVLLFAPNLNWSDVPLREMFERALDIPAYIDNEANMAAVGETYFGAAQGFEYVLYVSSGVGLGGGIVIDGRVLSGATGFAGEIGHMTMERGGLPCNCGSRGCWETLVSQRALFRRIREHVKLGEKTSLADETQGDLQRLTVPIVVQASEDGDKVARLALQETGHWLGIGIANLINVFNPQRVVFGGILSLAHEFLIPVITEVVSERAWRWAFEGCEIVVAKYGADACVIGGVATVYREIVSELHEWIPSPSR